MLALFGGIVLLSSEEQANAYYCESTNQVGVFYGGISSTGLTAYPFKENRTNYVRCSSLWIKLNDVKIMGEISSGGGVTYNCDNIRCVKVE